MAELSESEDPPSRLTTSVPLRWGDMDAYGHVNNVDILRILEEARVRVLGSPAHTGRPVGEPLVPVFNDLPKGTQALVAEHRVRYVAVLDYRDVPAIVDVWVSQIGGAGLTLAYEIRDGHDGSRCVVAETRLAFFDEPSGRLMRLDAAHRRRLDPYYGPSPFARR